MSDNETEKMSSDSKKDKSQYSDRRRKLLKGVATAAPVIMTVANRPAWGGYWCTLSGQLSGNLSRPEEDCGGEGCTPGFWKNHPDAWHPALPSTLLFSDVFGVMTYGSMSLGEVIQLCDETYKPLEVTIPFGCSPEKACMNLVRQIGFHGVAALQNAATSVSYDLTAQEVIDSVANALASGDKDQIELVKNELDFFNNQGCPLGSNAACGQGSHGKGKPS